MGKQYNQIWGVLIGGENKEPKIYALSTYRLTDYSESPPPLTTTTTSSIVKSYPYHKVVAI